MKSNGLGLGGILTIVFVTLKVLEIGPVAAWSWWWVLSPLWIGLIVFILLIVIIAILAEISRK